MIRPPPRSPLFPYTTLFHSTAGRGSRAGGSIDEVHPPNRSRDMQRITQVDSFTDKPFAGNPAGVCVMEAQREEDRKSTRLNSSHVNISYAVFCLKKKIITITFPASSSLYIPFHSILRYPYPFSLPLAFLLSYSPSAYISTSSSSDPSHLHSLPYH